MQPSPSALARLVDGFAAEGIRFGRRQTTTRSLRLGERAVPTLEKGGRFAPWCVSTLRVNRTAAPRRRGP